MCPFIPDALYRSILEVFIVPTVDLLFHNSRGEILLGLRNNEPLKGVWYIPGGRVNKGEPVLAAARRKALEELGLEIDDSALAFVGAYDDIFENSAFDGVSSHCVPRTYAYRLTDAQSASAIAADAQHGALRFFRHDDPSLHPMVRMRVRDMVALGILS